MNTSNLTPMRDLILLKTFGLSHHDREQKQWIIPDDELESIRQAIILDMVSKLEPAGYMNDDDYCSLSEPLVEDENGEVIPLYDLSAFKDTPK